MRGGLGDRHFVDGYFACGWTSGDAQSSQDWPQAGVASSLSCPSLSRAFRQCGVGSLSHLALVCADHLVVFPRLSDPLNRDLRQYSCYTPLYQERKFSPKRKFSGGHPCGHPAKNFGQALQILEKQAFRNGHPTRTSMKKLRSEKLRADFSFPTIAPYSGEGSIDLR